MRITLIIFFTGLLYLNGKAQNIGAQWIKTCDSEYEIEEETLENPKNLTPYQLATPLIEELLAQDYLETSLDSLVFKDSIPIYELYLHVGPKYQFEQLSLDSVALDLLNRIDIPKPESASDFLFARKRIVDYYSERGYPFTQVKLENLKLEEGNVTGVMKLDLGKQIIVDSLILNGDVEIRRGYLQNYLEIYKGMPYDHEQMKGIRRKLDQLKFLEVEKDPELSFVYNYASVNLFLKKKNSSRFDLIFGVIPTNNLGEQQLFLSLDFTAELLNKFGYGEYLFIDFERLRPEQQKFEINTIYPYILDTKFGLNAEFSIFRNEVDYQTVQSDLGLQYQINSNDQLKATWNYEGSKIIEIDSVAILNSEGVAQDSTDLSVTQSGLALSYEFNRLDHPFNPRRGLRFTLGGVAGRRNVLLDQRVLALNPNRYDSIQINSNRFQATLDMSFFKAIARRGAFATHAKFGWRYSKNGMFRNELFQIGGNKLLRGFDEASIFTPYYVVTTLEYRLLLAENSYFSAPFLDVGMINDQSGNALVMGLGGGLVLETKVGMFNFSVAVGQLRNEGFDWGRPKAHFGYISLF